MFFLCLNDKINLIKDSFLPIQIEIFEYFKANLKRILGGIMIKKIPFPMIGLILGLFALGNLLASYSPTLRLALGSIAFILYIFYTIKMIAHFDKFKEEMKNPVVAGVFATFPMATILLATYVKPYVPFLALPTWILDIAIHIALIIYFTRTFVVKKDIKLVFPTWFIVFVGTVVISLTSGAFNMPTLGKVVFWFGLISYAILLPVVTKRVFVFKNIPEPAFATVAIYTEPGGLLLAGYMSAFPEKNMILLYLLVSVVSIVYLYVLTQLPAILKQPTMPSISAITFPLVITAIGYKLLNGFFISIDEPKVFLEIIAKGMEIIAILCMVVACYRYMIILTKKES